MMKALSLGLFVLAVSASGAAADIMCGEEPIAPLITSVKDIQQKAPADAAAAKHQSFLDIKRWQYSLKSYRDCLNATVTDDKRKIGEAQRSDKPDKKKIDDLVQEVTIVVHAQDVSTDDEEAVVNEFNALSNAFCARTDVDRASCPKR